MGIWFMDHHEDWNATASLLVGANGSALTVARVAIENEAGLRIRIDIAMAEECTCFQDVRLIGAHAYIGYGSRLFVIDLNALQFAVHEMDGYFGHLYSDEDFDALSDVISVLVSSASGLLAFDRHGALIWKSVRLGIDGVVVHEASGGMLRGDGEWDPPGGWQPFTLLQATGEGKS